MAETLLRKKAVFLTEHSPFPPVGSARIRDYHQLRLLSENFDVEVLCFDSDSPAPATTVTNLPHQIEITRLPRPARSFWKNSTRWLQPEFMIEYSEVIEEALRARAFPDRLLWISRLKMAPYLPMAKNLGYRVVLDEHNVVSDILMDAALSSIKNIPSLWLATQNSRYEKKFCRQSHAVVAASDMDASKLAKLAPTANLHIIPNTIDTEVFSPLLKEEGKTLFFPGTLNQEANLSGLRWFASEVLPLLKRSLGNRLPRVVVAGAQPATQSIAFLSQAGIEVYANPPSMLPFLAEAAIVFIPTRECGGTCIKVLEAMAAGRAVVSTGKGAEGLVLSPTYDIFIADSADRFASAILHLLEDPKLRDKTGQHAAETVRDRYDWRATRASMQTLLENLHLPD